MEVTPQQPMDPAVHRDLVEPYLLGELSGEDRAHFERHLFDCEPCAEKVKAGSRLIETVRGSVSQRTIEVAGAVASPALRPARWRLGALSGISWGPALAAAAVVPLVGWAAYQQAVVIPGLRSRLSELDQPRALVASNLRPETRGNAQVVTTGGAAFVLLAFAPVSTSPDLEANVQDPAGRVVVETFSFKASPEPGEPTQVLLPVRRLPPGDYVLVVRHAGERSAYPFSVRRGR